MTNARDMTTVLTDERGRLARVGTAERVTEILREQIAAGLFPPGTKLSEEKIAEALGVSRNTLREAFRLLGHEKLVVHELNRGVFVRVLTAGEVSDLYLLRQIVERSALDVAAGRGAPDLTRIVNAVEQAEAAAVENRWHEVATLDLQFHHELVALAGSPRLDDLMRRLLAELRLAFHIMSSSRQFHEPYLVRNRNLVTLLQRGKVDRAAKELQTYLEDALSQLLEAFTNER
jgi:DNA-binding GntR family transcriptional regulator